MFNRILLAATAGTIAIAAVVTAATAAPDHGASRPHPVVVVEPARPASTTTSTTAVPAPTATTTVRRTAVAPRRARPVTTTSTVAPRRTAGERLCADGSWAPSC